MTRALILALLALALAACRQPEPDPQDKPVEPQSARHTELSDAIQRPIDKAKSADAAVQEAAERRDEAIEAAEGG
ncbi:MAG TPA: hypothetical protein VEY50_00640 [Lysobacter sp.]|nr:hypothetical protein [Lysobacter sp.]